MNNMVSRRSRIVFILDYLKHNSDEDHPVDTAELLKALEENGLLSDSDDKGSVIFVDSSYPNERNSSKSLLVKFGGEYICN